MLTTPNPNPNQNPNPSPNPNKVHFYIRAIQGEQLVQQARDAEPYP